MRKFVNENCNFDEDFRGEFLHQVQLLTVEIECIIVCYMSDIPTYLTNRNTLTIGSAPEV